MFECQKPIQSFSYSKLLDYTNESQCFAFVKLDHDKLMLLKSFLHYHEGKNYVTKLIRETEIDEIYLVSSGEIFSMNHCDTIVQVKKELMNTDENKFQKEMAYYNKLIERKKSIEEDIEREADTTSIEYFTKMVMRYLTVSDKIDYLSREINNFEKILEKTKEIIKNLNPKYKDIFLNILREKMEKRDEKSSFEAIQNKYFKIETKLFDSF